MEGQENPDDPGGSGWFRPGREEINHKKGAGTTGVQLLLRKRGGTVQVVEEKKGKKEKKAEEGVTLAGELRRKAVLLLKVGKERGGRKRK